MRKQSASDLIGGLEAAGYLACRKDPADKRALMIRFTPHGERFLQDASMVKTRIEDELKRELGPERYELLRDLLKNFPGVA